MNRWPRRVQAFWRRWQMARFTARQNRLELDEQRYRDREARHQAGIFEPPQAGGF